jgi:toxin HigB-1
MIKSFKGKATADLFDGILSKDSRRIPQNLHPVALRKLDMIEAAIALNDLRVPPGNHLEALQGDLAGKHSIRINDQWRITFRWTEEGAEDVEVTDYH